MGMHPSSSLGSSLSVCLKSSHEEGKKGRSTKKPYLLPKNLRDPSVLRGFVAIGFTFSTNV
jgi:hypothetical protein